MTSHLDSHTTTDVKPEMILGFYTGNGIPYDKYDVCGIAHVRTDRKDDIFMQRRLYIDKAHMALDISPLRLQYDLCHTSLCKCNTSLITCYLLDFRKLQETPRKQETTCKIAVETLLNLERNKESWPLPAYHILLSYIYVNLRETFRYSLYLSSR